MAEQLVSATADCFPRKYISEAGAAVLLFLRIGPDDRMSASQTASLIKVHNTNQQPAAAHGDDMRALSSCPRQTYSCSSSQNGIRSVPEQHHELAL